MKSTFMEEDQTKKALANFVLGAQRLTMAEKCAEFEVQFGRFQQADHAVLFNSGASANLALLQALQNLGQLKRGDRVGFSAVTWATNTMPILQLGMIPVPVDCEPATLNTMAANLAERLEEETLQAFFITNALGFAGDLFEIRRLCERRGILLIEDNCEALGTELSGVKTGSFGRAASFSFFVAHHLSTIEGGMVCTNDGDLAEMLVMVRANGWDRNLPPAQQQKWRDRFAIRSDFEAKYAFYDLAYNMRPTEITGFLGLEQLQYLDRNIACRAANYATLEPTVRGNPELIPFDRSHISRLSCFGMPIMCVSAEVKEKYVARFSRRGIEVRPMIAGNMQNQPFFQKYSERSYDLPGADRIHACSFYCGNYPELTEDDLGRIAECLSAKP